MFEVPVSSLQSGVAVSDGSITGTLKYLGTDNGITSVWGYGNFLCLKFTTEDWDDFSSVKVGLDPSASGMDLVEIKTDPDKNGIFKINNKDLQVFKLVSTDTNGVKHEKVYSLAGLTLEGAGA